MIEKTITKDQVKHVAKLANLTLSASEVGIYTKQLQQVLGYMDIMMKVDTGNIHPTYQVIDKAENIFRDDKIAKSFDQSVALSQAKRTKDGYFMTEGVFGKNRKEMMPSFVERKKIDELNALLTKVDPKGSVGHKDLFMTMGVETTAGSKVLEGYIAQYSSTVVSQFKNNGFNTKYKVNLDAWGHGASGENSDFGPTKNPWDKRRVVGGSSSGSAAMVAIGDVEVATGTDTGGSIRLPASFTNTTSIKPTYGALSRYGVIAFSSSLDCPSLIASSIKSLRRFYKLVAKPDKKDATSQSLIRKKLKVKKIKKIGICREFLGEGVDEVVKLNTKRAVKVLENRGYKIEDIDLPHARYGVSVYYIIAPTETSSNLARFDGIRYGNPRSFFGSEAKRRIMLGTFASSAGYADKYYEKAARIRTLIINDFDNAFNGVDAIIAPVSPIPPFFIGELADDPLKMYLMDVFTIPMSLAGIPSLALPCGFTKNNLPIGMQLMGPRWSESALFDLGEEYQNVTNWHKRKPERLQVISL